MLREKKITADSRVLTSITAGAYHTWHAFHVEAARGTIMARSPVIINRWYVSVEAPSEWQPTSPRQRSSRKTEAFPTEVEAKKFARAMLSEGMKVTAGTLNPHLPRRRIFAAAEINLWLEEKD
jgi:hypothetical protein